jgi:hypothetical protein
MLGILRRPEARIWLAIIGASTLVLGTAYAMVQQSTRQSANDGPQIAAQALKQALTSGSPATEAVPPTKTNLQTDLSVFVTVTDSSHHVLASSAQLNGKTPLPPIGTFDFTAAHGSDHFTWQPQSNVRLATEMLTYGNGSSGGFIIAGQSLKPFEDRVVIYTALAVAGWLAVLAWTSILLLLPVQKIMVRRKR